MANPLDIQAVALVSIQKATDRFLSGGNVEAWKRDMQQALTQAHTAAFLVGLAEQSFGGRVREFFARFVGERALKREDRNQLKASLREQLDYLDGFISDVKSKLLSEAQIRARAALYSGSTRGTYSTGRWSNINLPFHPTQGSECGANCKCSWEIIDLGKGTYDAYWRMGAIETVHCATCPSRAAASPYRINGGG